IFLSTAIVVILGSIAAAFASKPVARAYEKMADLKCAAEAASNFKTQFLASVSHEVRTQLNAIRGISELELSNTRLHGKSMENVEKIYSASTTMLGLINDLLDLSKIESGRLSLVPVVYDVPSMINDTIHLHTVHTDSKPIEFRLNVDEALPASLKGDELRVKQIFNNLLANAFKYTEAGFIEWNISCTMEGNRVRITSTVQDTGIGIRKEDQGKLFRDYSQVNMRANYKVEGTGLGLSITKKLVGLMGGSIRLESEYGKGSTFTVEFFQEAVGDKIIGKDTATNLSQMRYSTPGHVQSQKLVRADMSYANVLVVDDVISNLEIAKGMLKPYKITVDTAESGSEAVRMVLRERVRYDAIFMDHMMPGMDGIQTVKAIRDGINSEHAKTVPIIALTANALMGNDALYMENGFQAFLTKPIDVFKLDQVLNRWVRDPKKEAPGSPGSKESEPAKAAPGIADLLNRHTVPGLNLASGFAHLQNDKDAYLSVLRSFVRHTPTKIGVLKNPDGDPESYRIIVHGLKGSSRGIGAEKLGVLAGKLEKAAMDGDRDYIRDNNSAFIEVTEKLVADVAVFLEAASGGDAGGEKPEMEHPAPELLQEILRACEDYDIQALRKATETLASFRYVTVPNLAQWVTEQSHLSNFDAIQKRIASLAGIKIEKAEG
ncbi:MAG: ATP-binding protein, partial [Treponema sp.]|nr:ATP-binding protein [Treponema sp.]